MGTTNVNAILLIFHHPLQRNAPTIMEHVNAFAQYSQFTVVPVNTAYGFDKKIFDRQFQVVVFHYSLFGAEYYLLNNKWYEYLRTYDKSFRVAFFQDEFHACKNRFAFLKEYHVDYVFTLYDPRYWDLLYRKYTTVPHLAHSLAGYVSEDAMLFSRTLALPFDKRSIDVGYRARKLPFYMGAGAQEKWQIGREFMRRCHDMGMKLDISWEESRRIYGDKWYRFLGNCKARLGTESGVSITDLHGTVREECEAFLLEHPHATFEEVSEAVLCQYEGNIPLRTLSPRCFEAAAMRVCQVLYEGDYNGVLTSGVHYIELKKNWSNFDQVIQQLNDRELRGKIVNNAYRDLIASGRYSYRSMVEDFDNRLMSERLVPVEKCSMTELYFSHRQSSLRKRTTISSVLRLARRVVSRCTPGSWRRFVKKRLGLANKPK